MVKASQRKPSTRSSFAACRAAPPPTTVAGWRYEYLSSLYRFGSSWRSDLPPGTPAAFVKGRGAIALYRLGCILYSGQLPADVRSWFLGGRLIALSKDGDKPDGSASERKLRPIAIGSVIARWLSLRGGSVPVPRSLCRLLADATPSTRSAPSPA